LQLSELSVDIFLQFGQSYLAYGHVKMLFPDPFFRSKDSFGVSSPASKIKAAFDLLGLPARPPCKSAAELQMREARSVCDIVRLENKQTPKNVIKTDATQTSKRKKLKKSQQKKDITAPKGEVYLRAATNLPLTSQFL